MGRAPDSHRVTVRRITPRRLAKAAWDKPHRLRHSFKSLPIIVLLYILDTYCQGFFWRRHKNFPAKGGRKNPPMVYPSPPPNRFTTGFSEGHGTVRARSTLARETPTTLEVSRADLPFGKLASFEANLLGGLPACFLLSNTSTHWMISASVRLRFSPRFRGLIPLLGRLNPPQQPCLRLPIRQVRKPQSFPPAPAHMRPLS